MRVGLRPFPLERRESDPQEQAMTKLKGHKWVFKARFRRGAFGWRSQLPMRRIREAVTEIKQVSRKDLVLAAEGAVGFIERISPALAHVDSSSGAIGNAVRKSITQLVPIIATATVDAKVRSKWLDRLLAALEADRMPYIEFLGDYWGDLCGTKEIASAQADDLIGITRLALSPDKSLRGHFHGTSACLSALFRAERFIELAELTSADMIWPYKRWAVKALVAQGRKAEAIRLAESSRSRWSSAFDIDQLCEGILLSSGLFDEAYAKYGLSANQRGTYLATFRAVAKKYPAKSTNVILADLAATTPGEEGKWFAAAKSVSLYEEALALAAQSPGDPRTLTRAARDFSEKEPRFALGAGLLALHWLVEGYGYEITGDDVKAAYDWTMKAAMQHGSTAEVEEKIRRIVAAETFGERFVSKILGSQLGLG